MFRWLTERRQLLLGRAHDLFADVASIVVYPSAVVVPEQARRIFDGGARPTTGDSPVLGVAHRGGAVVPVVDALCRSFEAEISCEGWRLAVVTPGASTATCP